ncbi:DMT family transporter [Oceaniglobus indicus]|uniref:DMT family transporter n=1 Tax=Oceaniglobus indicus TaxID=2047749 RepID=UPI000C17C8B4|nr:DMT family transporter [Oceaniglobus indicus]
MTGNDTRRGIAIMVASSFIFAVQDGISRHLAAEYNVLMIVTIRYWFFAAFCIAITSRRAGGLRAAAFTSQPLWQGLRGLILVTEICILVGAFVYMGLVEALATFFVYPLIVAALSGPVLGERVGWRRWAAIGVGFCGILVMLQPGSGVFTPAALLPLLAAVMFSVYVLLNRYVARRDTAETSFFWTGVVGAIFITPVGLLNWQPMIGSDWVWMALLCIMGALGHFGLIKVYEAAEASAVQPFSYFHLVFGASVGVLVFGEDIRVAVVIGAVIVVSAGLFTLWRESRRRAV